MSAKRFLPVKVALLALRAAKQPTATIVLLAISLIGSGCATTSSQTAQYKPHKPQMITANGPEEVGECPVAQKFNHGFNLSDEVADSVPFVVVGYCLHALCGGGYSWKP